MPPQRPSFNSQVVLLMFLLKVRVPQTFSVTAQRCEESTVLVSVDTLEYLVSCPRDAPDSPALVPSQQQ